MDTILLAAALLPAIALMTYVYRKDKVESEPVGLVLRVFFLGAASGIVAGLAESLLFEVVESFLAPGLLLLVVEYFVCVAAVEEACKLTCLHSVRNRPEFDYVFDAIVYSVAAALGFAALENVFYVMDGGIETAIMRAILSVPGHAADGVVMGVFYGLARRNQVRGDKTGARSYYWLAFLLPTIEHGFYDAALSTDSDVMAALAIIFDLAFITLAFVLVRHVASHDEPFHPQGRPSGAQAPLPYGSQNAQQAMLQQQAAQQGQEQQWPAQAAPIVAPPAPSAQSQAASAWQCPNCGQQNSGNFCPNCGTPR